MARLRGTQAELVLDALGASVLIPANSSFAAGERVSLSLRPENIRVGPDIKGLPFRLEGRVYEAVYAGAQIRYTVKVGSEDLLVSVPAVPSASDILAQGDGVQLGWALEDCVIRSTANWRA